MLWSRSHRRRWERTFGPKRAASRHSGWLDRVKAKPAQPRGSPADPQVTTLRIGIAGIRGKMGREIAALATNDPRMTLIGGLGRQARTAESGPDGVRLFADVAT